MGRTTLTWCLIFIALAIMTIVGVWLAIDLAFGADVDKRCLTHEQAKAAYPGQYLYWRTGQHCWYPGPKHYDSRAATYGKQNSLKLARPPGDANGSVSHHSGAAVDPADNKPGPSVIYPSLMQGAGTTIEMLRPDAMTNWPPVYDIDEPPPAFIPWTQRISFTTGE